MRTLLFLLSIPVSFALHAQSAVRIVDVSAWKNTSAVQVDATIEAALAASGSTEDLVCAVKNAWNAAAWPSGVRGDSARMANAALIASYQAFRICTFPRDSAMMAVVMLPAAMNAELPEPMRPDSDLFIVLPERALHSVVDPRPRPVLSKGPSWRNREKVRIEDPARIYAAYDIAADSAAMEAMESAGMSKPEIAAVVFRSTERNWPDGIDSFEKRWPELDLFKKYRAYLGARWGNKALLIVPVEENMRMPPLMRPYMDMYLVFDADAVAVKGK